MEFITAENLSDSQLERLYDQAKAEGIFQWLGHDWPMSETIFRLVICRAEVFTAAYEAGEPLGFFFLTDFRGFSAQIHGCVFRASRRRRQVIGRRALDWCFDTFTLRCLLGLIPELNRPARRFAAELGGRSMGVIDGSCWMEHLKRTVDGHLFIFQRRDH